MTRTVAVIRVLAQGTKVPTAPAYVEAFDPDAQDGLGLCQLTGEPAMALHFADPVEAFYFCCTPSSVRPLLPDGRPNMPLTTLTVMIEPYEVPRAH